MSDDPVQNPYIDSVDAGSPDFPAAFSNGPSTIANAVKQGTIIHICLVMGMLSISGIMTFMTATGDAGVNFAVNSDSLLLLVIGVGACLMSLAASIAIKIVTTNGALMLWRSNAPDVQPPIPVDSPFQLSPQALGGLNSSRLISAALLEGGAVINAVFILINENLLHLIPIGIAAVAILLSIPSTGKYKQLIEATIR